MSTLIESVELLEASTRLDDAAFELFKLAEGENVSPEGMELLKWVADLLARVDYCGETNQNAWSQNVTPDIAVRATNVRPTYYAAFQTIKDEFTEPNDLVVFVQKFPRYLLEPTPTSDSNEKRFISIAAKLLREIARSIFLEIGGNLIHGETQKFAFCV